MSLVQGEKWGVNDNLPPPLPDIRLPVYYFLTSKTKVNFGNGCNRSRQWANKHCCYNHKFVYNKAVLFVVVTKKEDNYRSVLDFMAVKLNIYINWIKAHYKERFIYNALAWFILETNGHAWIDWKFENHLL